MVSVFTNSGEEWVSRKVIGDRTDNISIVAVGTGTSAPQEGDTSLDSEVYRASSSDSVVDIEPGSGTGEIIIQITLSGGTEVSPGTTISELGAFAGDGSTMLYREVPDTGTTFESGDRKTLESTLTVK